MKINNAAPSCVGCGKLIANDENCVLMSSGLFHPHCAEERVINLRLQWIKQKCAIKLKTEHIDIATYQAAHKELRSVHKEKFVVLMHYPGGRPYFAAFKSEKKAAKEILDSISRGHLLLGLYVAGKYTPYKLNIEFGQKAVRNNALGQKK